MYTTYTCGTCCKVIEEMRIFGQCTSKSLATVYVFKISVLPTYIRIIHLWIGTHYVPGSMPNYPWDWPPIMWVYSCRCMNRMAGVLRHMATSTSLQSVVAGHTEWRHSFTFTLLLYFILLFLTSFT